MSDSKSTGSTWVLVLVGGFVFLLGGATEILNHFHSLEFLQSHWNNGYLFLMSEKTHFVLIVTGMAMLGLALQKLFQRADTPSTPSPQAPTLSASATGETATATGGSATGGGAHQRQGQNQEFRQDIKIYNAPPQPRVVQPSIEDELPPNVTCIGIESVSLIFGLEGHGLYVPPPNLQGDFTGIIARFRNEGGRIGTANLVKASIRFKDANGSEIGSVSGVRWIGNRRELVNIKPDHVECLPILARVPNKQLVAFGLERQRRGFRLAFFPRDLVLRELPRIAEIRLRDNGGEGDLLLPKAVVVEISEVDGKLQAKRRDETTQGI